MLVKVHSYFSTTFVPGQFTPESWDVPNGYAETGVNFEIMTSDVFEVENFSAETHLEFSLFVPNITNFDIDGLLTRTDNFNVLNSATTHLDIDQQFSGVDFKVGIAKDTDIGLNGFLEASYLEVLQANPTTMEINDYLESDTVFFGLGETLLKTSIDIRILANDLVEVASLRYKVNHLLNTPNIVSESKLTSKTNYSSSGQILSISVQNGPESKPYN